MLKKRVQNPKDVLCADMPHPDPRQHIFQAVHGRDRQSLLNRMTFIQNAPKLTDVF